MLGEISGIMVTLADIENHLKNKIQSDYNTGLKGDDFGHATGDTIEKWVFDSLSDLEHDTVFSPHVFLNNILNHNKKEKLDHIKILNNTWWAKIVLLGKPVIRDSYQKSQQEGADLILHNKHVEYDCLDNIRLINVKSHNMDKKSRHPNILSSMRLIKFIFYILKHDRRDEFLNMMNYWIISISHSNGVIKEIHAKDLFLLDISKIPMINFDAALQIQWHVKDMVEIPDQTKIDFIRDFVDQFITSWEQHKTSKDEKYKLLAKDIRKLIKSI